MMTEVTVDSEHEIRRIQSVLLDAGESLRRLQTQLEAKQHEAAGLLEAFRGTHIRPENIPSFVKKPYTVVPRGEKEWFLIVPRFLDFHYGWLFMSDESYNTFIINRYVQWLYPIPEELKHDLGFEKPALEAKVVDGYLHTPPEQTEDAFQRYRDDLLRKEGPGLIRIKSFKEFDLISHLIRDGILPFEPQPVKVEDLGSLTPSFQLRDYQHQGWDLFLRYGASGIFWPPGAGKMWLAMYALSVLKGSKLVVVPTLTLIEEWRRKIKQYVPQAMWNTIEVTTYISADKYRERKQPFTLVVFDECQHLPANTYARLALLPTKYRLGLSATPFREDGRVDLIFALTGYPVGLAWDQYFQLGLITKPIAHCYIVPNLFEKLKLLKQLASQPDGRTIVFCDSLDLGNQIAKELNVPFIHGETKKRLETIGQHQVTVVSRVGDEGIDIIDLKQIIEVSFLYGSRRQELQRFGRLLHSRFKGKHNIIMTKDEYDSYKKRLLSLYEKGFQVVVQEVAH